MSDVQKDLARAKRELGIRLGLVLEDRSVVSNLQDRYRRHLKQQVAPESNVTGQAKLGAQAILEQIRLGGNPVQNIIEVALTGKDELTRTHAESKLQWISELPDVRSAGIVASRASFEAPGVK